MLLICIKYNRLNYLEVLLLEKDDFDFLEEVLLLEKDDFDFLEEVLLFF
jgi:hypothetical protein